MEDPFNILGQEFDAPPSFDAAVKDAVERFRAVSARFDARCEALDPTAFSEDEWGVIEHTADELEAAVERCEEAYVAVQYDSHAWYRILENLEQIVLRLESTMGMMDRVESAAAGNEY